MDALNNKVLVLTLNGRESHVSKSMRLTVDKCSTRYALTIWLLHAHALHTCTCIQSDHMTGTRVHCEYVGH